MSTTEIAITCAAASHERQTVKVATFNRGQDGRWEDMGLDFWPKARTVEGQQLNAQIRGSRVTTYLVGDEVAEPGEEQPDPSATRLRHMMRCRLCGLSVRVLGDRLDPLLDRAGEAGVSTIPLAVLAATVM